MRRKEPFVTGQYYHVYNRGVDKRRIFMNKKDCERFLDRLVKYNRVETMSNYKKYLGGRIRDEYEQYCEELESVWQEKKETRRCVWELI